MSVIVACTALMCFQPLMTIRTDLCEAKRLVMQAATDRRLKCKEVR